MPRTITGNCKPKIERSKPVDHVSLQTNPPQDTPFPHTHGHMSLLHCPTTYMGLGAWGTKATAVPAMATRAVAERTRMMPKLWGLWLCARGGVLERGEQVSGCRSVRRVEPARPRHGGANPGSSISNATLLDTGGFCGDPLTTFGWPCHGQERSGQGRPRAYFSAESAQVLGEPPASDSRMSFSPSSSGVLSSRGDAEPRLVRYVTFHKAHAFTHKDPPNNNATTLQHVLLSFLVFFFFLSKPLTTPSQVGLPLYTTPPSLLPPHRPPFFLSCSLLKTQSYQAWHPGIGQCCWP